ncbi:peptidase M2 [Iodidimonas muriae]|uniref:Peptidase M2 n=1 Tax=Iodidimonas muriae TaxID=261467 RepID=A0ABQ2LDV1_9PROT|nr:M2 family metallopeptidase [Iodidimonas muriae]GER06879.1 peptidase M2 [Kordiimonadales bacterium JCM 17843]GGO09669.1 peptidase M2 [Iodidimonas muriae]
MTAYLGKKRFGPASRLVLSMAALGLLAACDNNAVQSADATKAAPTVEDAIQFVKEAEATVSRESEAAARTAWVNSNFITYDTNWLSAKSSEKMTTLGVELAQKASTFRDLDLPDDVARKINLLRLGLTLPAPAGDTEATAELAQITTDLEASYGKGKYCPEDGKTVLGSYARPDGCLSLTELEHVIGSSSDPDELLEAWSGWRTISPAMKDKYARMVDIANAGAEGLGFKDVGTMWRSKYDMDADAFAGDVDRLWGEVKPLYDALQCHVRAKLNESYGDEVVPLDQAIPAHLLGNMWAQSWGNVYDKVAPEGTAPAYDLTALLAEKNYSELDMVKTAEGFFTSVGFDPLPETFYERSLFLKPEDRDVVCHASAWNLNDIDDIRIKMCIKVDAEDFQTIHHEIGHNIYQRAYSVQDPLFRNDPNDGFHEAIGDMIALSITPDYLQQIGLLQDLPPAEADLGILLRQALDKVAFLPFGLMVDKWRWQVFSGELTPDSYNDGWWKLREQYQGVRAPNDRPADAFDPGAKFHIPGNTPYMRYFLSHIFQFQFQKAACDLAGWEGPLHRCSIYGNEAVGEKFNEMLEMGASKPWQDALAAFTGKSEADATAILAYFAPLKEWLDEQNADRECGW